MKTLILAVLVLCACATVQKTDELEKCPAHGEMTEAQYLSGVVQCRALCSSYGRNLKGFDQDCRCICAAAQNAPKPATPGLSPNVQM